MRKIIHHVRKQPEHIKRHILRVTILACAIVLFMFWIHSLGTTLTNTDMQAKTIQDLKPFSILKENITGQYDSASKPDPSAEQQIEQQTH